MFYSIFKRRRIKSKIIFIIFLICFLMWLQKSEKSSNQALNQSNVSHFKNLNANNFDFERKNQTLEKEINQLNTQHKIKNFHFIKQILNDEQTDKDSNFSKHEKIKYPYPAPKFFVILIQVHSRLEYLKELLNSLRETRYINETLVIFSHDLVDNEINKLIESIDFCAVSFSKLKILIINFLY